MSMEDILKELVNSRQQGGSSNSADPMASLISGLLGGGQPQRRGSSQQSGGDMAGSLVNLLGTVMGSADQQPQNNPSQQSGGLGNMMGLLETVMGGGQGGSPANDPIMMLLKPFVTPLAKKANISPEIAMIVVSFVAHKLLAHHPTSGRDSNSFNLDDMLQQIGSGRVDSNMLQNSGMVKEISAKTGLDEATAANTLNAAFNMMGNHLQSGTRPTAKAKAAGMKGRSKIK